VVGDHMPPNKQVQSSSKFQLPFASSNNVLLKVRPCVPGRTAAAAACKLTHSQMLYNQFVCSLDDHQDLPGGIELAEPFCKQA
jgi:hypothetical protein